MPAPLESIIQSGTKLWLDSVDPDLIEANRALGATGATSNPIIISDLIKTGRYDDALGELLRDERLDDAGVAWQLTDQIVRSAQKAFRPVWESTSGNNGYVSFELDPLLEDPSASLSVEERTAAYIELGAKWSAGHDNRMIKTPATAAGLAALEELTARGVTLNVTLLFYDGSVSPGARRDLARRPAARLAQDAEERLQHFHIADRCLHAETRSRTVPFSAGRGGHRQCQTDLARESRLLG